MKEFDVKEVFQFNLWHGSGDIHRLHLKNDAVNAWLSPSPFQLSSGRIGTFTIQIPWSNFLKNPIRIYIQDLGLDLDLQTEDMSTIVPLSHESSENKQ